MIQYEGTVVYSTYSTSASFHEGESETYLGSRIRILLYLQSDLPNGCNSHVKAVQGDRAGQKEMYSGIVVVSGF